MVHTTYLPPPFWGSKLAKTAKDPFIAKVLLKDLYVDDQILSVATREAAVALVEGTHKVLKSGGFHLTKFVSNCNDFLTLKFP